MIRISVLFIALVASAAAQEDLPGASSFLAQQSDNAGRSDSNYQQGLRALDARDWEKAINAFEASVSQKRADADGALYWKAYAQNRAGRPEQALTTIAALRGSYPSSRWLDDAQALAVEIQSRNGAPVNTSAGSNEELKLIALNSLMQSQPDRALPILQKILSGNDAAKVKERALFVLTQNSSPEAHKLLGQIARNSSDARLQIAALRYMGMMGNEASHEELASIYSSSNDPQVKRAILQAFMTSGARSSLLSVARSEKDPQLRRDAIRNLALSGGQDELAQLYQSDQSIENRKAILESMFLSGESKRLIEVARNEKNPELRAAAIHSLGLMHTADSGAFLVSMYQSDTNRQVRDAVLQALFIQQNGKALVDLARAEKDPHMKEEIVKKMALVQSKETTDYMMEILR